MRHNSPVLKIQPAACAEPLGYVPQELLPSQRKSTANIMLGFQQVLLLPQVLDKFVVMRAAVRVAGV